MTIEWNGVRYDEFIKPDRLRAVERAIERPGVTIVFGPSGTGKTTAVYLAAMKLGYKVIEVDETTIKIKEARNLLLRDLRMKSFLKKVYLYDTPHYHIPWSILSEIASTTRHPFVIIYPDRPQLPDNIAHQVTLVEFTKLRRREVVEYLRRKFGPDIDVSKITSNLTQSILALTYRASPMSEEDIFTALDRVFTGKVVKPWDNVLWVWIIEHIDSFFSGKNLFKAVRLVSNSQLYNFPEALAGLRSLKPMKPMYVKYRYPYFFRRKKAFEEGGEQSGK